MKLAAAFLALALAAAGIQAQEARPLSRGQSLYLPIYSHLLYGNVGRSGKTSMSLLSALVSIRNTDGRRALKVTSARYYDTGGVLLKEFVSAPVVVPPFGTHELFIEQNDASGGSGANFLIKWEADGPINPPLVEALHANMDSARAVIVTTQAVPVQGE